MSLELSEQQANRLLLLTMTPCSGQHHHIYSFAAAHGTHPGLMAQRGDWTQPRGIA